MLKKIFFIIVLLFSMLFIKHVFTMHISLVGTQYTLALDLYSKNQYYSAIKEFNNLIARASRSI